MLCDKRTLLFELTGSRSIDFASPRTRQQDAQFRIQRSNSVQVTCQERSKTSPLKQSPRHQITWRSKNKKELIKISRLTYPRSLIRNPTVTITTPTITECLPRVDHSRLIPRWDLLSTVVFEAILWVPHQLAGTLRLPTHRRYALTRLGPSRCRLWLVTVELH